jgi:hypothetical protein
MEWIVLNSSTQIKVNYKNIIGDNILIFELVKFGIQKILFSQTPIHYLSLRERFEVFMIFIVCKSQRFLFL